MRAIYYITNVLLQFFFDTNSECFVLEPETISTKKKASQRVIFDDHILVMLKVLSQ